MIKSSQKGNIIIYTWTWLHGTFLLWMNETCFGLYFKHSQFVFDWLLRHSFFLFPLSCAVFVWIYFGTKRKTDSYKVCEAKQRGESMSSIFVQYYSAMLLIKLIACCCFHFKLKSIIIIFSPRKIDRNLPPAKKMHLHKLIVNNNARFLSPQNKLLCRSRRLIPSSSWLRDKVPFSCLGGHEIESWLGRLPEVS